MNDNNSQNKEELLADIEKLMQYDAHDKTTINPALLAYLDVKTLIATKKSLLEKRGSLSEEDKEWLQQFKRYD
jgi:hypothetical protein